jgi:Fe-S cluster biosynthesis and repair protein YggX
MEKTLNFEPKNPGELRQIFDQKSAAEWEEWAKELDLQVVAVKQ